MTPLPRFLALAWRRQSAAVLGVWRFNPTIPPDPRLAAWDRVGQHAVLGLAGSGAPPASVGLWS